MDKYITGVAGFWAVLLVVCSSPLLGHAGLATYDLAWGQDLNRLSERLKQRGIGELSIAHFGTALLEIADLPHYEMLSPAPPTSRREMTIQW